MSAMASCSIHPVGGLQCHTAFRKARQLLPFCEHARIRSSYNPPKDAKGQIMWKFVPNFPDRFTGHCRRRSSTQQLFNEGIKTVAGGKVKPFFHFIFPSREYAFPEKGGGGREGNIAHEDDQRARQRGGVQGWGDDTGGGKRNGC